MDRITAIKAISRNLHDLVVDTIPASMTGTSVDALKLIHPITNQLQGKNFYIYSGAGAGQERTIGSFNTTNRRAVFPEAFITVPSINSNFLVFTHWMKSDYDNAVDRLVGMAKLSYLQYRVATMALAATQYEYLVPSGFDYIGNLRLVPSGSDTDYAADDEVDRIFEIAPSSWLVTANPQGSYTIVFDPRKISLDSLDEEWMTITGQAKLDVAATDNATIPEDIEEYIIAGASAILASERISEGQEWKSKFSIFRQTMDNLEPYVFRHRRGKRVGG